MRKFSIGLALIVSVMVSSGPSLSQSSPHPKGVDEDIVSNTKKTAEEIDALRLEVQNLNAKISNMQGKNGALKPAYPINIRAYPEECPDRGRNDMDKNRANCNTFAQSQCKKWGFEDGAAVSINGGYISEYLCVP